jgi:RNA polymerase sigma-70 factor (ECF subfamily)
MERVVARDSGAFTELFDGHSPVVLGMLVKMLRRRDAAEEVLQETFLQAWNSAEKFDPDRASPRGWLILMARSKAIDRLRSSRSRADREERRAKEDQIVLAQHEPAADETLLRREREQRLERAIETLPDEQKSCIRMAFFDGLTHSELANRLDQPLGTVKSRISLGMKKLRQELQ